MIPTVLHPDVQELLFSEETLERRIRELGKQLSEDYAGRNPLLICVLKGAIHFFTELTKAVTIDCEYEFAAASSYGSGTESSGEVVLTRDLIEDVSGRDVIVVDDIIDTGLTLQFLSELLQKRKVASVKTCVLLDKPERRTAAISADYVGFVIPNHFVVGYGLDYRQKYRNLPYIGILKPEQYRNPPAKGESV